MTTQLQKFQETISYVASQQGNDSNSSYIDIDEIDDDDDVTGPADRIALSKQPPKVTVESSDNYFLAKIAPLAHKVHFLLSLLGINDVSHNTEVREPANLNNSIIIYDPFPSRSLIMVT